jgi:hypothetical protein
MVTDGNGHVLAAAAAAHESVSASSAVMWGGVAVYDVGVVLSNEALGVIGVLTIVVSALWNGYHRRREYLLRKQVLDAELTAATQLHRARSEFDAAAAGDRFGGDA